MREEIKEAEEKGDGLAFHNAVKLSKKKAPAIFAAMDISSPTLYRLFKQETIDEETKKAAAKALNCTVEDIFGAKAPVYNDALPLINGEVEKNKSGNEFISVGHGMYLMITPLVHEYAYGGYLKGYSDPEYIEDLPKHSIMVKNIHKGVYRSFVMLGDSMDNGLKDAIESGDMVTGRLIEMSLWKSKLHMHKYKEFIIHHKDGIIIKQIIGHDVEKGIITIHSKNPDKEEFPDEPINLEDCKEVYNVVEVSKVRR